MNILKSMFGPHVPVALVVVVVVLVVIFVLGQILLWPGISLRGADEPQIAPRILPTQSLQGSQLDNFQASYGPWLDSAESRELRNQEGVRNFVILFNDGDVLYSENSVTFTGETPWSMSRPPEITGVEVAGTSVSIQNQLGEMFTLNITQPFIFSGRFARVYLVDEQRQVWSVPISALTFAPASTERGVGILPNNNLSVSFGR